MPMIIMGTTWRRRFVILSEEKNRGLIIPNTMVMIISATDTEIT
jgi:hypothetical protein